MRIDIRYKIVKIKVDTANDLKRRQK